MYENEDLSVKDIKFNHFLNKTIIGAGKKYYEKQKKLQMRELMIVDDENYQSYLNEYVSLEPSIYSQSDVDTFDADFNNIFLSNAIKSLTYIERLVIFLLLIESYQVTEVAQMLGMYIESISRIKKRALNKLRKYMEGV